MRITMSDERQETLEMIRQSAKDFAQTKIRPNMMEWDESQHFPARPSTIPCILLWKANHTILAHLIVLNR